MEVGRHSCPRIHILPDPPRIWQVREMCRSGLGLSAYRPFLVSAFKNPPFPTTLKIFQQSKNLTSQVSFIFVGSRPIKRQAIQKLRKQQNTYGTVGTYFSGKCTRNLLYQYAICLEYIKKQWFLFFTSICQLGERMPRRCTSGSHPNPFPRCAEKKGNIILSLSWRQLAAP